MNTSLWFRTLASRDRKAIISALFDYESEIRGKKTDEHYALMTELRRQLDEEHHEAKIDEMHTTPVPPSVRVA